MQSLRIVKVISCGYNFGLRCAFRLFQYIFCVLDNHMSLKYVEKLLHSKESDSVMFTENIYRLFNRHLALFFKYNFFDLFFVRQTNNQAQNG